MSAPLVRLWFTRHDQWRAWGWVALAAASVLLAWTSTRYFDAADRLDEALAARAAAQQRQRDSVKIDPSENAADAQAAVGIDKALRYDWNEVFNAIEGDVPPPWSVISMQVQRDSQEIRLLLERPLPAVGASRAVTFPAKWIVTEISEEQGAAGSRSLRAHVLIQKSR